MSTAPAEPSQNRIVIYTDGGCHGNPGPGGWAAVMRYGDNVKELSGSAPVTTNNRMELSAAIGALEAIKRPCTIPIDLFTDSEYLRNGITKWIFNWKKRNWRTAEKQPVQNAELWMALDELNSALNVKWHWVKGHAGNRDNERCDALAAKAISSIRKQYTKDQLAQARAEFDQQRRRGGPASGEPRLSGF